MQKKFFKSLLCVDYWETNVSYCMCVCKQLLMKAIFYVNRSVNIWFIYEFLAVYIRDIIIITEINHGKES